MRFNSCFCIAAMFVLACANNAPAQQLTVQQPALSTFSVGTTVSVPDSGRGLMGGVSRAGSGRVAYGPLRSGTNTGVFGQGSTVSARVTIHDFVELDRQALHAAASRPRDGRVKLSGHAEHAYQVLQQRATTERTAALSATRRK